MLSNSAPRSLAVGEHSFHSVDVVRIWFVAQLSFRQSEGLGLSSFLEASQLISHASHTLRGDGMSDSQLERGLLWSPTQHHIECTYQSFCFGSTRDNISRQRQAFVCAVKSGRKRSNNLNISMDEFFIIIFYTIFFLCKTQQSSFRSLCV